MQHRPGPRIFCIGRNYAKHVAELGEPASDDCVIFMKPASCRVAAGDDVSLPRDRGAIHHEAEVVVRIGRGGKDIAETRALAHVDAVTLGLDLTLRDLQNRLKRAGAPWELCKAFEHSAPLGDWQPVPDNLQSLRFECRVNEELRQSGDTADMLFPVARLIAILSATWTLAPGDMIFTGTPEGVGPLNPGDKVSLTADRLGAFSWRMV